MYTDHRMNADEGSHCLPICCLVGVVRCQPEIRLWPSLDLEHVRVYGMGSLRITMATDRRGNCCRIFMKEAKGGGHGRIFLPPVLWSSE